jgi:hypothetical protein
MRTKDQFKNALTDIQFRGYRLAGKNSNKKVMNGMRYLKGRISNKFLY